MEKKWHFQTLSIHGARNGVDVIKALHPPIYQTVAFEQRGESYITHRDTELKYSREENPTVMLLEKKLAVLEEGEDALAFASGMSAISSVFVNFLNSGDKILLPYESYGTTQKLIKRLAEKYGIEPIFVYPDTENILNRLDKDIKVVFVETITNPTLKVFDIPEIAKACKETGTIFIVDNTFATPVLYKPLPDGADVVIHSLTKYMVGHADAVGGAVISSLEITKELWDWRNNFGGILSPFSAFLIDRGLKTLELRMARHCENALRVVNFLKEHPKVEEVLYPTLEDSPYYSVAKKLFKEPCAGGVLSFKIKGDGKKAIEFLKNLKLIFTSPSFGAPETIASYPVKSAAKQIPEEIRKKLGITENLIRLAVGLENAEDIIADLDQALSKL
jgi:cystathionine gamma-synthase